MFISLVFFSVSCIALAFLISPVYRVSTILIAASSDRGAAGFLGGALAQYGGIASLAGISVGAGDTETEEALAVLRSRRFTERFIEDNNLLPKLFAKKWDVQSSTWKVAINDQPTLAKGSEYFGRKVRAVIQDKKTGLITLQIDWRDRKEAAEWANELVRRLNEEMRLRAIAKTDSSIAYLEKELKSTDQVGTREAIGRLLESQMRRRMLANVSQEYSFRVIDAAMAPDVDDHFFPNKPLFLVTGVLIGLIVGVCVISVDLGVRKEKSYQ